MGIRKCLSENSRYWYFAPLVSRCSSSCRHSGTVSDWELLIRRYPGDPRVLDRSPSSHIQLPVLCVPPTAPESAIKLTGPGAEQRARTTTAGRRRAAPNGTYACAREGVSLATSNPRFGRRPRHAGPVVMRPVRGFGC